MGLGELSPNAKATLLVVAAYLGVLLYFKLASVGWHYYNRNHEDLPEQEED